MSSSRAHDASVVLQQLYRDRKWSDLKVITNGGILYVHKAILCPANPYFWNLCCNPPDTTIQNTFMSGSLEHAETLIKHIYGFQAPILQLRAVQQPDIDHIPVFEKLCSLRLAAKRYSFADVEDITTLLLGEILEGAEKAQGEKLLVSLGLRIFLVGQISWEGQKVEVAVLCNLAARLVANLNQGAGPGPGAQKIVSQFKTFELSCRTPPGSFADWLELRGDLKEKIPEDPKLRWVLDGSV